MSDLIALLRQLIQAEITRFLPSQIGVVEQVKYHSAPEDTANYGCDVRIRDYDLVLSDVPIMTDQLGTVAPPAVGDVVLIHYVGGDSDFPVIGGRLYSDQLRPPNYSQGQNILQLPPASPDSDRVDMTIQGGQAGERYWTLKLPDKVSMTVNDTSIELKTDVISVTLDSEKKTAVIQTGAATISLDGDGNIKLQGKADISIEADGNIELKSKGNLALSAEGEVAIKGETVNLN